MKDIVLAIDVGTGSVRAALVDQTGNIIDIVQKEHDQITPHIGWSEQSPSSWWQGATNCTRELLSKHADKLARIAAVASCGQMHGTVLLDADGELAIDSAILWNDKRTESVVQEFKARTQPEELAKIVNNPPTTAWSGFKLMWVRENLPEVWSKIAKVVMPKDFINYKLSGTIATDYSEASCFYLMDHNTREYSDAVLELTGIPREILPNIYLATDVIGEVTESAAQETLIPQGTPVVAGTSDFAATLLGSGVHKVGQASDSTGTSTLITVVTDTPSDNLLLNNLHLANPAWGTFSILDAGGDAMRWARLALQDNAISYAELVESAKQSPVGANSLIFLPYLTGERNANKTNSRAQFFGLARKHRVKDLYRSVMEGVAFAAKRNIDLMNSNVDYFIASGGGAKDDFWLEIKASIYNRPIVKTKAEENGVLGCAMIAGLGVGLYQSIEQAVEQTVQFEREILPNPAWVEFYAKEYELFNALYEQSQNFYDALDNLDSLV
ncbi:xylulokinase [Vibrio parahaemolyticus]|uniref:xylulokinase n=1 Tax=Vibrio parahaemolyticus TaxID=670 RepID=UPI0024BD0023|nr:FGGY family carbohydrate kinase [Vibrio parahaemolyticus]EGQ8195796.1 pentose kinase [Vibrio parahaemolyticus]WHT03066.1 FGGY family carbohydrate kinase [Vibrio parahaemolyticus]